MSCPARGPAQPPGSPGCGRQGHQHGQNHRQNRKQERPLQLETLLYAHIQKNFGSNKPAAPGLGSGAGIMAGFRYPPRLSLPPPFTKSVGGFVNRIAGCGLREKPLSRRRLRGSTVLQIPGNVDHHDAPVAAHQQNHLQQAGAPVVQQALPPVAHHQLRHQHADLVRLDSRSASRSNRRSAKERSGRAIETSPAWERTGRPRAAARQYPSPNACRIVGLVAGAARAGSECPWTWKAQTTAPSPLMRLQRSTGRTTIGSLTSAGTMGRSRSISRSTRT